MHNGKVEGFHLSPQQRRLWALSGRTGGPYVAACIVNIRGDVDLARLKAVLEELPAHHEILRTTFYASEEMSMPIQVISPGSTGTLDIEYQDLSGLDARTQRGAIDRETDRLQRAHASDEAVKTRIRLATLSPREYVLAIGASALRSDARGLNNLVADIATRYEAAQRHLTVSDDALQYADASVWLNDMLESPETAAGRQFWESQELTPSLSVRLPFERADPHNSLFVPRRAGHLLSAELLGAARRLASERGTSIDTVLLACWQCLLQRISDTNQIIVGFGHDGRNYPELERAVGLFSRFLPLSGDLSQDCSFADAIRRLDDAIGAAKKWGECFDWRGISPSAHGSGELPFIPFVFESMSPVARHEAAGVVLDVHTAEALVDRFRMKLCSSAGGQDPGNVWIEYDSAAYDEEDVARLGEQFQTLATAAVGAPDTPLAELDLLPPAQTESILTALQGTRGSIASELVHSLFELHAARIPGATAVVCEQVRLTYAELNERSNRLAHHLQAHGVGPDVLVGLCLERSTDMIVSLLAILKAGGAYVPLDPQLPPPRLASILAESGAEIVIGRERLAAMVPSWARTVLIDGDDERIRACPNSNPGCTARPDNLVYVLFTSGSTGTPKGVAVEHRQLASYVRGVRDVFELTGDMSYATVTTIGADLGNTAIYPALTSGGSLHIVTEARAQDAEAFADYMARQQVDVLKIVPSHLKALLSCSEPARVLPAQRLILGGEACPWDLMDAVHRLAPQCRIFNHYGPTETTVGATTYSVPTHGDRPPSDTVPIGRPLPHVHALVLDRNRRMVPVWTPGELYIGGAGVARGYLQDAGLTAARFIVDPLTGEAGGRMYRTGDRVRLLTSGDLEFLGRIDDQVKIRGFRVELGEVESSLRRHPAVSDAAVLAHDDGSGNRLASFVVYRNGKRPASGDLRTFLQAAGLPEYMIPHAVIELDILPLTPNGKLDRRALSELLVRHTGDSASDDTPLTEWEAVVAGIWRELLDVDRIAASDNFYDLGGHSLIAIQVVTALEKRAGVHVSPRDLVFHTLRQFAVLCESKSSLKVAQT